MPSAVAGLRNLQCLDVRFNQLVDLPVEMQGHASLVEVLIAGNRFTQLPNVIYTCKKVETIVASDNQISYIDVDGKASCLPSGETACQAGALEGGVCHRCNK